MPETTDQSVVVRPSAEVVDAQQLAVNVSSKFAELLALAPVEGEGEGLNRMLSRILEADDLDSIAALFSKMDNSRSVANRPLMIRSIAVRESDYQDGLGVYLTVYADDRNTGDPVTFNTGASTILATLLLANAREWFPFPAHVEVKVLKTGNTASNLILDV